MASVGRFNSTLLHGPNFGTFAKGVTVDIIGVVGVATAGVPAVLLSGSLTVLSPHLLPSLRLVTVAPQSESISVTITGAQSKAQAQSLLGADATIRVDDD